MTNRIRAFLPPESPQPKPPFDHTTAEARPLALDVIRWALADLETARARLATANALREASEAHGDEEDLDEGLEWERWIDTLVHAEIDAQRRVMALVLMTNRRIKSVLDLDKLPPRWQPCSMEIGPKYGECGPILVVAPRDEDDEDWHPTLTIVPIEGQDSFLFGA